MAVVLRALLCSLFSFGNVAISLGVKRSVVGRHERQRLRPPLRSISEAYDAEHEDDTEEDEDLELSEKPHKLMPGGRLVDQAFDDTDEKPLWKNCDREQSLSYKVDMDDLDSDAVVKSLRGKSILILGDSVAAQYEQAIKNVIGYENKKDNFWIKQDIRFDRRSIALIPENATQLESLFQKVGSEIKPYDYIILHVGLWYNWPNGEVDKETTEMQLKENYASNYTPSLMQQCGTQVEWSWMNATSARDWANNRKTVCQANTPEVYISDLNRLLETAARLKRKYPMMRFFWKTPPPQFFRSPTGLYAGGHNTSCQPIQDPFAANIRSYIARRVFSRRNGLVNMIDTFKHDARHYKLHAESDCTHFCNPSGVYWYWAKKTLQMLLKEDDWVFDHGWKRIH